MMSVTKVIIFDVYNTLMNIQTDENRLSTYEFISSWLCYKGLIIAPNTLMELYQEIIKQELSSNMEDYPDIDIGDVFEKIIYAIDSTYRCDMKVLIEEISLLFRMLTTKSIKIYPETVPMLESLYKAFRLAILSNAQRLFTLPEIKKFNIEKYFECIFFSSDVKASKPNQKIFTTLINSLKIQPHDAIFVGDNLFDDIWGAQQIGIKTVWINRDDSSNFPIELERPTPDREVNESSYRNLPDVVLSLI